MGEGAQPIVEHVPARAALAGNPSDGYAGAVFAIPVDAYTATVTLQPAARWSIADGLAGLRSFDSLDALINGSSSLSAEDPHALLLATITEFLRRNRGALAPCSIDVTSTIPVSVGLAGSSAIVIGTFRALFRATGHPLPHPTALASMALHIELNQLGIAAGMQDRLVQAFGTPVFMRFDRPDLDSTQVVEPGGDLRLLVAHRAAWSEPSQVVHGDLRRRFDGGDQLVQVAMSQLRTHAFSARDAFNEGSAERLGESMDATFDLRASMLDLVPEHVEMIEVARAAGASANYTGSGGAVIVLSPTDEIESAVRQSLKSLGCEIVPVDAGSGAPLSTSLSSAPSPPD